MLPLLKHPGRGVAGLYHLNHFLLLLRKYALFFGPKSTSIGVRGLLARIYIYSWVDPGFLYDAVSWLWVRWFTSASWMQPCHLWTQDFNFELMAFLLIFPSWAPRASHPRRPWRTGRPRSHIYDAMAPQEDRHNWNIRRFWFDSWPCHVFFALMFLAFSMWGRTAKDYWKCNKSTKYQHRIVPLNNGKRTTGFPKHVFLLVWSIFGLSLAIETGLEVPERLQFWAKGWQ